MCSTLSNKILWGSSYARKIFCPNSINYVLKIASVSKSCCEYAEYDMRYIFILSTAGISVCKYRQRDRDPSRILSEKIHAGGIIYRALLVQYNL